MTVLKERENEPGAQRGKTCHGAKGKKPCQRCQARENSRPTPNAGKHENQCLAPKNASPYQIKHMNFALLCKRLIAPLFLSEVSFLLLRFRFPQVKSFSHVLISLVRFPDNPVSHW